MGKTKTPLQQIIDMIDSKIGQLQGTSLGAEILENYDQVSVNNIRINQLQRIKEQVLIPALPIEEQAFIEFAEQVNADGDDIKKIFNNKFK